MAGEETTNAATQPETSVPIISASAPASHGGTMMRVAPAHLWPYETATGWGPWSAFFIVVLITIVSLGVAMAGSVVLVHTSGRTLADTLTEGTPLVLFFVAQVLMVLGAVVAALAKGGTLSRSLALKPPIGGFWSYAKALFLVLAAVTIYTAFSSYVMRRDVGEDLGEMVGLFRGPWWPMALVVIGIGAPLSEELVFRGFLQTALVPTRLGYWGASLITTAFWTALHAGYSLAGMVEVFMIGMIFAWLLRRTGSLRVTLACHAIYNTGIALVLVFAPKELLGF